MSDDKAFEDDVVGDGTEGDELVFLHVHTEALCKFAWVEQVQPKIQTQLANSR